MKKFLYWAPRMVSMIMAAFITIFAFDVFGGGDTGWKLMLALVMHLLPSIVAVIIIIIAWKWEQVGGWLFVALGIGFVLIGRFNLAAILLIALPFIVVGVLFLLHYHQYVKGTKDSAPLKVE